MCQSGWTVSWMQHWKSMWVVSKDGLGVFERMLWDCGMSFSACQCFLWTGNKIQLYLFLETLKPPSLFNTNTWDSLNYPWHYYNCFSVLISSLALCLLPFSARMRSAAVWGTTRYNLSFSPNIVFCFLYWLLREISFSYYHESVAPYLCLVFLPHHAYNSLIQLLTQCT